MKIFFLLAIVALLFSSCSTTQENGFTLTGQVSGETPAKAFLQLYSEGEMKIIDSADFTNGEFILKGEVAEPDFYYLQIGDKKDLVGLFIENSVISIFAHTDSLKSAIVSGSLIQDQYNTYKESLAFYNNQYDKLDAELKNTEDPIIKIEIENKLDSIDNLSIAASKEYVAANNSSFLAPYIIRRELIYSLELTELETITNVLNPELKGNKYTKQILNHIENLRPLQPGMSAPDLKENICLLTFGRHGVHHVEKLILR